MKTRRVVSRAGLALLGAGSLLLAEGEPPKGDAERGFPVTSEAVKSACGSCHASDAKGCMTRISWRRTTPEGWQETIRRMASLNGASLDPARTKEILRTLANEQGLAPEEALPARFELERRLVEFTYRDADTQKACGVCHSIGRPMLQRRSATEWDLLVAMHRGYYPVADFQAFRRPGPAPTTPGPDGRPPDPRQPVDKALDHLKSAYPLHTPEWSDWVANRRPLRLSGRWALSGYELGTGPVYGEVTIDAAAGAVDEFVTTARYAPARGGPAVLRKGQAVVYTGFQWRGRSLAGAEALREVMMVERDQNTISGRWFAGGYDEKGVDVTLVRLGADPVVLGVWPGALKAGEKATVQVYGANLERIASASDVDFGPGVNVLSFSKDDRGLVAQVEVAPNAPPGARDVRAGAAVSARAAVVYSSVDALKVTPQAGLARVGGLKFPKRFEQFEAHVWSNGADGKPDTPDDLDLGLAHVSWSLDEFTATFGDDDKTWVGSVGSSGLFTPAEEGPNPKRTGGRNNVGDVWVVAQLDAKSPFAPKTALRARAHLIVTVPLYARWDTLEVHP